MKFCKIYIKEFEQFQDVVLDFTNPETGEPVEKICLIGKNGTGKTKVLRIINWFFHSVLKSLKDPINVLPNLGNNTKGKIVFKILHKDEHLLIFYFFGNVQSAKIKSLSRNDEKDLINSFLKLEEVDKIWNLINQQTLIESTRHHEFLNELLLKDNANDLVIYSPAESKDNKYLGIYDVPKTSVSDSLALFNNLPFYTQVSQDTVDSFWKLLVFNLKKRQEQRETFETTEENLNKTKAQLIKEFDLQNPQILNSLAEIWGQILRKAGLKFDVDGANNPIQLADNLRAYIKVNRTDKIIPYSELSTGIRNFIFRIGHIYSLYFNREIERAFLLIDEPENSLFPDFLFDLVETYQEVIIDKNGNNNTQIFFATHNPIIAAQFQPYERIILDWQDDGTVIAKKGVSPIGDDPNDILSNDFELKDLLGPEGRKSWRAYQDLKKKLIRTTDKLEKEKIIEQINLIGNSYNFS